MSHDFKKKEPTKTEKVLYELMMRQEMMDRSLWTTSAHVIALGKILNVEPEKIAEMLVNGNEDIKTYGNKINDAIKALEAKKHEHKQNDEKTETAQAA